MPALRIIFMGTPEFAASALQALIDGPHTVIAAYSQPPKPQGRGQQIKPSPVQALAAAHGIPVYTPKSLKTAEAQAEFAALDADIAVVAAYGLILPQAVLDLPRLGCVNIHASLLPRWRGAAPIQRAILAGDTETGITFMQMDTGLDTGAMLKKMAVPIDDDTTTPQLHDTLAAVGAMHINALLSDLSAGNITPQPQPADGVTYADKLKKEEGSITLADFTFDEISRKVRALNPWPGVWAMVLGKRVKILKVSFDEKDLSLRQPCKDGIININTLQPENKKPMSGKDFMNGF